MSNSKNSLNTWSHSLSLRDGGHYAWIGLQELGINISKTIEILLIERYEAQLELEAKRFEK